MGITGVIANTLTIGTPYAFFALRTDFFERINHLTSNLLHYSAMRVHFQRLEDVIGQEPEAGLRDKSFNRQLRKAIRVEDVTIRFSRADEPILTGVA